MKSEELTAEIKRLNALPWTPEVKVQLADAYWARRRAWEEEQNIPPVCHDDGSPV